jgi:hypothetical protein
MSVVDSSFYQPLQVEEVATMPLAGGIMNQGYQCGMLWGAALAAGAEAYRLYGPGSKAETEAIIAAQRCVESFHAKHNNINCLEITEINLKNKLGVLKLFLKGGPVKCTRMIVGYAPIAFGEINTAFNVKEIENSSTPVGCTAMLAQKMGLSDMHTAMAAGLAGGIGLSGGGCGALGAAIWILGMNSRKEGLGNKTINSKISDLIDKFIKNANFELECSEIVGRKFENIDDHAVYIRDGGCSNIIDMLTAELSD